MEEFPRLITVEEYFEKYFFDAAMKMSPEKLIQEITKETAFLYLGYYKLFKRKKIDIEFKEGFKNKTNVLFLAEFINFEIQHKEIQFDQEQLIKIGKEFFNGLANRLYNAICVKFQYCKRKLLSDISQRVLTAIVSHFSFPLGIGFIITSLLTIRGLDNFCHCRLYS